MSVSDIDDDALRRLLPFEVDQVLKEANYQNGEQSLRDYFLAAGHAHVETEAPPHPVLRMAATLSNQQQAGEGTVETEGRRSTRY